MVKHAAILALASFCLQPYASPDEQILRKLGLKSDPKFIELKGPGGMFSLEYPEKDWQVVPGGGSVVLTLAQKGNQAFIVIDHSRSDITLSPDEVGAVFLDSERARVANRQSGSNVTAATMTTTPAGPVAMLHYTRPGLKAQESVVQYSVPFGQDLFRLICSAQTAQFAKFEPVFVHVAGSFLPRAAGTGASPSSAEVLDIEATALITPPRKVKDARPVYPPDALARNVKGTVVMKAEIGVDGSVRNSSGCVFALQSAQRGGDRGGAEVGRYAYSRQGRSNDRSDDGERVFWLAVATSSCLGSEDRGCREAASLAVEGWLDTSAPPAG